MTHPLAKIFWAMTSALLLGTATLAAAEPENWPGWRAPLIAKLTSELTALDTALASAPDSIALFSQRGDRSLFLGHFPEAVADYEKMIVLDPSEDARHWRLGIAYYFTGQFGKSAEQFAKYHAYDGRDRENGIWKFLAQAQAEGVEQARAEMLTYTRFDREPFPSLYEMFAGRKTPDEVLAEIREKGLDGEMQVVFFGNYYVGLEEERNGRKERALVLLEKAVTLAEAQAPGGPGYMWQVARLHWERLRSATGKK